MTYAGLIGSSHFDRALFADVVAFDANSYASELAYDIGLFDASERRAVRWDEAILSLDRFGYWIGRLHAATSPEPIVLTRK